MCRLEPRDEYNDDEACGDDSAALPDSSVPAKIVQEAFLGVSIVIRQELDDVLT